MRKLPILVAGTAVIAMSGCGFSVRADTGPRIDRAYPVSGFTGIDVAGHYNVTVRTGSAPSVHASGSEQALDNLRVEVKDGMLEIGQNKRSAWTWGWSNWHHSGPVNLVVTVPSLDHAGIAGSGAIKVDKVSGARFRGEIAGSGDLVLPLIDAGEVSLSIAGSGGIHARGKAKGVKYEIAGSGNIDATGLAAETADVSIAGSGGIKGHASNVAKVDVMGSGDVTLTGGAKCSVSKSGSGNVQCS
ncbi:MAG: head GIN domain-containing protein [Sphingomicrobium sp.]